MNIISVLSVSLVSSTPIPDADSMDKIQSMCSDDNRVLCVYTIIDYRRNGAINTKDQRPPSVRYMRERCSRIRRHHYHLAEDQNCRECQTAMDYSKLGSFE